MLNYKNEIIEFRWCPWCAYTKHEFSLPCGLVYENDNFTLSQDREVPIVGFFVISPRKHIEKLNELSEQERNEMFSIINTVTKIEKDNNICKDFNIIFYEKDKIHFHVRIMPRHERMSRICNNITQNIGLIFDYAKKNFRTENIYNKINEAVKITRGNFEVNKH